MTTLADIRGNATESGEWVNGSFEAVVRNASPRQGNKPSKATLVDPKNPRMMVKAALFKGSFGAYENQLIRFGGKGTKAKLYNGDVELSFSDKCTMDSLGKAPDEAGSEPEPQREPSRHDDRRGGGGEPAPQQRAPAGSGALPVQGQTVGMALNQACENIRSALKSSGKPFAVELFTSPQFSRDLHTIASDIIRVSRVLEAGHLAPSAKDRADPEFEKKQKEAAEQKRIAAEAAEQKRREAEEAEKKRNSQQLDEDVPF